jgi:hypothetical protein
LFDSTNGVISATLITKPEVQTVHKGESEDNSSESVSSKIESADNVEAGESGNVNSGSMVSTNIKNNDSIKADGNIEADDSIEADGNIAAESSSTDSCKVKVDKSIKTSAGNGNIEADDSIKAESSSTDSSSIKADDNMNTKDNFTTKDGSETGDTFKADNNIQMISNVETNDNVKAHVIAGAPQFVLRRLPDGWTVSRNSGAAKRGRRNNRGDRRSRKALRVDDDQVVDGKPRHLLSFSFRILFNVLSFLFIFIYL